MTQTQPTATNLSRASVERLAESVATQLGYEHHGHIKKAVEALGGRIVYQDFEGLYESDSGSLEVYGPGNLEIRISTNTSVKRDRFTIAHEIGHYVLHFLYQNAQGRNLASLVATRYGSDKAEWEANWFAASFLMPQDKFRDAFEELGGDIGEVADKFGVSTTAAQIRAKALKLIE